jgi:hypothetical protein
MKEPGEDGSVVNELVEKGTGMKNQERKYQE